MSEPDAQLQEEFLLGLRFEDFIKSKLGVYLVERAERERKEVLEELASADPFDPKEIARLQVKVMVLDSWQQWMADAILDGERARLEIVDFGG